MTKMEFFKILEEGLIDFPAQELQDILYDYKEHFSNAQSDGKSEQEIIEELGDPYVIVNQYRKGYIQISSSNDSNKEHETNKEEEKESFNNNSSSNGTTKNHNVNTTNSSVNTFLKICIAIGLIILVGPITIGGFSSILALGLGLLAIPFAFSVSGILMLFGKFGFTILGFGVPAFFADFPISVIILITIGSIAATILSFILLIYLIKLIILLIRKLISKFSSKGGY